MAASSLTGVLDRAAAAYAEAEGRPAPRISYGGSSRMARQVLSGAPADIVIMAHPRWMEALRSGGAVAEAAEASLATNALVFVVPRSRPASLGRLDGLASSAWKRVAVAAPRVPAGIYAREALGSKGLLAAVEDRLVVATSARAALATVATGHVDGGFVYRTDAMTDARVRVALTIDPALYTPILYQMAPTRSGADHPDAAAFVAFLGGAEGQGLLQAAGFEPPVPAPARTAAPAVETPSILPPLGLSLWVAGVSLLLSIIPAVGMGWLMARREFPGKAVLSTLLMSPLVLPPVVTGYLLLQLFGHDGVLGPVLERVGLEVAFSRWGAVVAAAVVGFPLLLILVRQAIESVDQRYPSVAQTLGLSPMQAFVRVTLPMALPGIAAGCVLAFARALGEFGATAMIAGDHPGETRTLALAVYALAEQPGGEAPAATLVWVSLGLCAVALLAYERLVWRQRRRVVGPR